MRSSVDFDRNDLSCLGGWIFCTLIPQDFRARTSYVTRSPLHKPRSGELWTQTLNSHPVRTQSLNVLPLKRGVSQYIAIHATLAARDFFLAYFYPSSPFTRIYSNTSPDFFLVFAVADAGSCVDPQNETGRSPCWMQVPVLSARGI